MYVDDEDAVDSYGFDDEENEVLPCPSCGLPVYEDAERCPHCGDWIMPLAAASGRPFWVRIVGVIVVIALLLGLVGLIRVFL